MIKLKNWTRPASLAATMVIIATLAMITIPPASAEVTPTTPQWWNRGQVPLYSTSSASGETARMPDGSVRTYRVFSGAPAYLAEIDTFSAKVLRMITLHVPNPDSPEVPADKGAQGAWGVSVDKHGTVFASTYGFGHVYRLPWGATEIEDLGRPTKYASFTWEGDVDDKGNFYIGTTEGFAPPPLPGGRLISWNADTRTYRDYGDFGEKFGYVRSVEYAEGKIYAGLGQSAGLWQVDPVSGKRVEIPLPKGMPTDKYAYQMEDEAGYLYVMFAGGTTASTGWVLNLRTLKWAYEIPGYLGQTITSADARGRVYLIDSAELKRFDPRTGTLTGTGYRGGDEQSDKGGLGAGKGLGRFTDPATGHEMIVGGGATGDLWRYDTVTKTGILTQIEGLVGTPTAPRSLAKGPDGRIYGGGYFQGGFVAYDPATTKWTEYHFPHQIEGMATHNGKLYLGIYANAEVWEYDPAQPFVDGTNPKKLFDLKKEGQERPWTVVSAGKYVAIGTSPKNTQLNGAVTLYDPATGERRTWNSGLVDGANQIAALTYRDGILYGGSLGCCNPADGSKHRGQVFALDAATGAVKWTSTPLADEDGVAGLTFDGQGRLFGQSYGTVFELDPADGSLLRSKKYFDYPWPTISGFQPRAVNMNFDPGDGAIYTTSGTTRRIDPDTLNDLGPNYRCSFADTSPGASKFYVQNGVLLEVKWY